MSFVEQIAYGEAPPSTEAVAWLRAGFRRYLSGDADLTIALSLSAAARAGARNRALRHAACIIDDGRALSPWELADRLEHAVHRFEIHLLPRLNRGSQMALTPLDSALRDAFQAGPRMLRSRRRLYDLLY